MKIPREIPMKSPDGKGTPSRTCAPPRPYPPPPWRVTLHQAREVVPGEKWWLNGDSMVISWGFDGIYI